MSRIGGRGVNMSKEDVLRGRVWTEEEYDEYIEWCVSCMEEK